MQACSTSIPSQEAGDTDRERTSQETADHAITNCQLARGPCSEETIKEKQGQDDLVEVIVQHVITQKEALVKVSACATMLDVKKALIDKVGHGEPSAVQLAHRVCQQLKFFKDIHPLAGARTLLMLGVNLSGSRPQNCEGVATKQGRHLKAVAAKKKSSTKCGGDIAAFNAGCRS